MSTMPFPQPPPTVNPALFGWAGTNVNQNPSSSPIGPTSPIPSNFGATNTNPYGQGTRGGGDLGFNLAETNLQTGVQRNQLAPIFAKLMTQYGGQAGDFFKNLMNFGSPFYKAQQSDVFTQGTKANQDAAALSRQQLNAQGYGATPSGATAAMIGGQNVAGSNNLVEQFLQTLFNNQNLMVSGAEGLSQLASLFNPSNLLTAQVNPGIQQPTNTAAEDIGAIANLMRSFGK